MKSSAVVLTIVFCTGYWLTRSSWLPRPASPASTTKVETVHPHGCGKLFPLFSCGLSVSPPTDALKIANYYARVIGLCQNGGVKSRVRLRGSLGAPLKSRVYRGLSCREQLQSQLSLCRY